MTLDWTSGACDSRVNSRAVDLFLVIVYFVKCYVILKKKNIINSISTLVYAVIVSAENRSLRTSNLNRNFAQLKVLVCFTYRTTQKKQTRKPKINIR